MMWVLISVLVLTVFVFFFEKWVKENLAAAVVIMFVMFSIFIIGGSEIIAATVPASYNLASSHNLKSLETDSLLQGSFFLGSGSVNEELHYFYYEEINTGAYQLKHVPVEESVIYETDASTGLLKIYTPTFKSQILSSHYTNRYEFHIPTGSITQRYNPNVK